MGFFDEIKREMKKAAIEGMRGKPLADDEDIDNLSVGAELVKEAVKSNNKDSKSDIAAKDPSVKNCEKCGSKLNTGALFCGKCGTKVVIAEEQKKEDENIQNDENNDNEEEQEQLRLLIKEKTVNFQIYGTEDNLFGLFNQIIDGGSDAFLKKYNLQLEQYESTGFYLTTTIHKIKLNILDFCVAPNINEGEFGNCDLIILETCNDIIDDELINLAQGYSDFYINICKEVFSILQNHSDKLLLGWHFYKYKIFGEIDTLKTLVCKKILTKISEQDINKLEIKIAKFGNTLEEGENGNSLIKVSSKVPQHYRIDVGINKDPVMSKLKYKEFEFGYFNFERNNEIELFVLDLQIFDFYQVVVDNKLVVLSKPFSHITKKWIQVMQFYE